MITFDTAYHWLNRFDEQGSYLRPPLTRLVKQMQAAVESRDFERVSELANDLLSLSAAGGNEGEIAETRIACARAYYHMGQLRDALNYIAAAIPGFRTDHHNLAVAKWLYGCVLWRMPGNRIAATDAWLQSMEIFRNLAESYASLESGSRWYQACSLEMDRAIQEAEDRDGLQSPSGMRLFFAFEQFPGGQRKSMIVEQYCIGGRSFYPVSLRDEQEIAILGDYQLFAVREPDGSMAGAGIDEGDYVLFSKRDWAADGDIVVALRHGEKNGVIRRFVSNEEGVTLQSGSLDDSGQSGEDQATNEEFTIKGVAVAILKPY